MRSDANFSFQLLFKIMDCRPPSSVRNHVGLCTTDTFTCKLILEKTQVKSLHVQIQYTGSAIIKRPSDRQQDECFFANVFVQNKFPTETFYLQTRRNQLQNMIKPRVLHGSHMFSVNAVLNVVVVPLQSKNSVRIMAFL